jgi:hypothetical protein
MVFAVPRNFGTMKDYELAHGSAESMLGTGTVVYGGKFINIL